MKFEKPNSRFKKLKKLKNLEKNKSFEMIIENHIDVP